MDNLLKTLALGYQDAHIAHALTGVHDVKVMDHGDVGEPRKSERSRFTALLSPCECRPATGELLRIETETGLEDRLNDRHGRVHRGAYRALPSQEEMDTEGQRQVTAAGHCDAEDKIVQQAVVTVLNQIYEEDLRGFSYGFRPGRGQHQALDALYVAIHGRK